MGTYINQAVNSKKKASSLQKSVVGLDIKIKKWKDVPECVAEAIILVRARVKAISDALSAFPGVHSKSDCARMEAANAALDAAGLEIPRAFHVLFFKEKASEHISFHDFDSFVQHINEYIQEDMFDATGAQDIVEDVVADGMKTIAQGCDDEHGIFTNAELLGELADKLCAADGQKVLTEPAMANIAIVGKAFGGNANCTGQTRMAALAEMLAMLDETPAGILLPLLREPRCARAMNFLQAHFKSSQPLQEMLDGIFRHMDKMSGLVYTEPDRDTFIEDLVHMIKLYGSMEQQHMVDMRRKLTRIFESFMLSADSALGAISKQLVNAVVTLVRQAEGATAALDATGRVRDVIHGVKDQMLRYHLDINMLTEKLSEHDINVEVIKQFSDEDKLRQYNVFFTKVNIFVDMLPGLCADIAAYRTDKTTAKTKQLMGSIIAVREAVKQMHAEIDLRPLLGKFEIVCGIGKDVLAAYDAGLADFKAEVSSIVQTAHAAFAEASTPEDDSLPERVAKLSTAVYTLKQQASFSESPNHDRDVMDLMVATMPLCLHVTAVKKLKSLVPKDFKLDGKLSSSLQALIGNVEETKPKVQWMLGSQLRTMRSHCPSAIRDSAIRNPAILLQSVSDPYSDPL